MSTVILLSGISLTTFAASGVFFFKFWRASRDPFFILFGTACWLIAAERLVAHFILPTRQPIYSPEVEATSWIYLLRLFAFLLILIAIVKKSAAKGRTKAKTSV